MAEAMKPRIRCWSNGEGFSIGRPSDDVTLWVRIADFASVDDAWAGAALWLKTGESPYPRPHQITPLMVSVEMRGGR